MLKWVIAIVAFLAILAGAFYYAMKPAGLLALHLTHSYSTNGGYMVEGTLVNQGRQRAMLRATNGAPEFMLNIQTATGMYTALGMFSGTHSKALDPEEEFKYQVFVPTNAPAVIYIDYQARTPFKRGLRRGIVNILTGGRGAVPDGDIAARHVAPP